MAKTASPLTHASRVFERLRQDIVNGRFKAGEKIAINALKARYEVGLSPLREALNKLAAYGLLIQENQRGFRVPGLDRAELDDIVEMRRRLECMALEQAMRFGDAEWESALLAAAHRLRRADADGDSVEQWEALHLHFHRRARNAMRSGSCVPTSSTATGGVRRTIRPSARSSMPSTMSSWNSP